ncbi:ATP-dependent DNA helicase [Caerostris darwini]|uniref:ATP-dependent DNA helicase n=1 Tax=Caerostris darwini TaxID=1538125 RepID=A0AAV4UXB2_9ARAC|nr:ATP-dependent DNA helicase [Caerostris darwini]
MEDNVKAHDRERKRIARSKPETRARQNTLQRERRALKRQRAINPHDDNIKHTKCVQTPSLYSPSCSCPLKDTFNSSSSVTPSCSHCFLNNTHSDLNDYSHEKQWLKVEEPNYGFRYPEQPSCLSELNDLEERLVALRIPFMQIRELGRDRQYGIKGSVTNVPNDLHKSVDCLHRNVNDSATIYVKLKKQSFPEGSNAFADLNPISSEENDESDIEGDDYDDPFVNPAPAETVINKLNTNIDAGLALAPGENQMPLSVLFDDLAEELSYPRIYCGDLRRFTRKKPPTYSEIVKSELRRYDRRGATPQKILYSHQKNLHKLLLSSIQICLRNKIHTDSSLTAQQVQDQLCLRQLFYKNQAYKFMKMIKCSPAHFENEKNCVCAQIRQFGMPTLFLTLSAAISCTHNANTKMQITMGKPYIDIRRLQFFLILSYLSGFSNLNGAKIAKFYRNQWIMIYHGRSSRCLATVRDMSWFFIVEIVMILKYTLKTN